MLGHLRQPHQLAKISTGGRAGDIEMRIGLAIGPQRLRPGIDLNAQPQRIGPHHACGGQLVQQRIAVQQPAVCRAGGDDQAVNRQALCLPARGCRRSSISPPAAATDVRRAASTRN